MLDLVLRFKVHYVLYVSPVRERHYYYTLKETVNS